MKRISLLLSCLLVLSFCTSCSKSEVLFNGENLDGWTFITAPAGQDTLAEPTFSVRDGALHISGEPFGYIRTEKKYSEYTLLVEWRWCEKRADSGIFTALQEPDKVWPAGVQLQMRESDFGYFFSSIPLEGVEGPFFRKAPICDADPELSDGEWNKTEIVCKGGKIRATVNGVLVNEAVSDANEGYIGFQSEGGEIEFRDIRIRR